MKTLQILQRKQLIACAYLMIALLLILLTIFPLRDTQIFSKWVVRTAVDLDRGDPVVVWICAALFLTHFFYGAFYYPRKYLSHLRKEKDFSYSSSNRFDLSFCRGAIASGILMILILSTNERSLPVIILALAIIVVNFSLSHLTRTDKLFSEESVTFDSSVLIGSKEKEVCLYYLLPKTEDKRQWENDVIITFIKRSKAEAENNEIALAQHRGRVRQKTEEIQEILARS
jgi:hypothetical protein